MIDNGLNYLEFQQLENQADELEKKEYNQEIQSLLEEIWELQCEILNSILIN